MAVFANGVAQTTALVVGLAWVIEDSRMGALQMLSLTMRHVFVVHR
jgi:hypothetical protein